METQIYLTLSYNLGQNWGLQTQNRISQIWEIILVIKKLKENRAGKVFHTRAPLRPGLIRKLCPSSPSARPSNQLSVLSLHW